MLDFCQVSSLLQILVGHIRWTSFFLDSPKIDTLIHV